MNSLRLLPDCLAGRASHWVCGPTMIAPEEHVADTQAKANISRVIPSVKLMGTRLEQIRTLDTLIACLFTRARHRDSAAREVRCLAQEADAVGRDGRRESYLRRRASGWPCRAGDGAEMP